MSNERLHRCPLGQSFLLVSTRAKLAAIPDPSPAETQKQTGPLWDLLASHGIPAGTAGANALMAKFPNLPVKINSRIYRFFDATDVEKISKNVLRTVLKALETMVPDIGISEKVTKAIADQAAATWRQKSLHPHFLALAGEPAEAFCLAPSAEDLPPLMESWDEENPAVKELVTKAIKDSIDLAAQGKPWLNRWEMDKPTSTWLWSWRASSGIGYLNGGAMFTRFVWAIFTSDGALPSIRVSRSAYAYTPPGVLLSQKKCTWTFTERAWSATDDHDVEIHKGIDLEDPLRPDLKPLSE
jgi:hypothetical protein